jgi:hypothetical protein
MSAFNRFYNPTQSGYQSQFVPENLPVDLMAKSLYAKQAKADNMLAASQELGEWSQRALTGYDTNYVKGIQDEVKSFAQEAMSLDRTSPEFQRRYLSLTNKIKNDEGLKKVQASVLRDDAFWKRQEELVKSGALEAAKENKANYMFLRDQYTATDGLGFSGEGLDAEMVSEGVDLWEGKTKYFKELKESGSDSIRKLASGISYKTGFTGVTEGRIKKQLKASYDDYLTSPAGEQERRKVMQEMGLVKAQYNKLDTEDRKKVDAAINTSLENNFLEAGLTYVRGKSTSTKADALNAQRTEDRETDAGVVIPTTEKVVTRDGTFASRDKAIKSKESDAEALAAKIRQAERNVANGISSGYTKEGLANLKRKMDSTKREVAILKKEKNEDYKRISNAQKQKVKGEYDALVHQTNQLMPELTAAYNNGTLSKEDYLFFKDNIDKGGSPSTSSLTGVLSDYGAIENMLDELAITPENAALRKTLRSYSKLEKRKTNLSQRAANQTEKIWQDSYSVPGTSTTRVQRSGATTRTDAGSTMFAINNDVVSNSEAYTFTVDGKTITPGQITKFQGFSVTPGSPKGGKEMDINGVLTFKVPKVDAEGNTIQDSKGGVVYETRTAAVNATPHGAQVSFLKNNFAREYEETARIKEAQGKEEEAAVARGMAMNLNSNSNYLELVDFEASKSTETTIATTAYSNDGRTNTAVEILISKIGTVDQGGGYEIKYGNIVDEVPDLNALNAYIQTVTNNTIRQ